MPTRPFESDPRPYSAVVLGSTGNVGRQIVWLLAASPEVSDVVVLNRRQTGAFVEMGKVREVVVPDMDTLAQAVEAVVRQCSATIAFCAIGVGSGSQKLTDAEFRRIEVQYPQAFVRGCKAGGVLSLGIMTASGCNSRSSFRYVRIIGEKEEAAIGVGIPSLSVYKPSVILGNSNTPAYLHALFPILERILPTRFHSIHKDELARAMIEGTQQALAAGKAESEAGSKPKVKFYEYADMQALLSGSPARPDPPQRPAAAS